MTKRSILVALVLAASVGVSSTPAFAEEDDVVPWVRVATTDDKAALTAATEVSEILRSIGDLGLWDDGPCVVLVGRRGIKAEGSTILVRGAPPRGGLSFSLEFRL